MSERQLPVVVIGAGPVGLAAAAHLLERGLEPLVLERGASAAANVAEWRHVRLFSPWSFNVDDAARRLLERDGWVEPEPDVHPTGGELIDDYLRPLADAAELRDRIRLGAQVVSVGRLGFDKMKTDGRERAPFQVLVEAAAGEERILARAVIDASGSYATPSPVGGGGVPAVGERALADRVTYRIPDVLGAQRARFAGRRVLVAGSGHSAFNTLRDLVELQQDAPDTRVVWALRRRGLADVFGGGQNDQLAERGRLGAAVRELVADGAVEVVTGFATERLYEEDGGVVAEAGSRRIGPVDEVVAVTGYRPDLEIVGELRLGLDTAVESPSALAPLIDPNVHSCGSVPPHGERELAHPEPGFYIVGMKSYGRAPTFLLRTGYEQVRSVVAALAGDREAAERVELVLPETRVCKLDSQRLGGGCGAPEREEVAVGAAESDDRLSVRAA
jgi:thioredoxin reductase